MGLFDALLCDAALFATPPSDAAVAVAAYRRAQSGATAGLAGPLLVADTGLAEVDRCADAPIEVTVLNTGGAGGLPALARRNFSRLRPSGVISPLRDPGDLAGNTARVVAAARELEDGVEVYLEFPSGYGWQNAVAAAEAEGLAGRTDLRLPPEQLVGQLSAFIEADLPFRAGILAPDTAPGVLGLVAAVDALIDDAAPDEAVDILGRDDAGLAAAVRDYDDARTARIRRRLRGIDCADVPEVADRLSANGLIAT